MSGVDQRERRRRLALTRCQECREKIERSATDAERAAAIAALQRMDLLPADGLFPLVPVRRQG
jgi:hypothetical protein